MDVLLVSGRSSGGQADATRDRAAEVTRSLVEDGHQVRWLCPVSDEQGDPDLPTGAALRQIVTQAPEFRRVLERTGDVATDSALTEEIRRRLPDIVHVLAFGGASSSVVPWIANRLGVAVVASVDARELLCHRGTLIDDRGQACDAWADASRCTACCLTPFAEGLTEREARRGRRLSFLGSWSPYPQPHSYERRLSLLVGGLLPASLVIVRGEPHRDLLERAGVPRDKLRVADDPSASALRGYYAEAQRAYSP